MRLTYMLQNPKEAILRDWQDETSALKPILSVTCILLCIAVIFYAVSLT